MSKFRNYYKKVKLDVSTSLDITSWKLDMTSEKLINFN